MVDDKVVPIHGGIQRQEPEVDPGLLDIAQQLVDKVKSGQVQALVWATVGNSDEAAVTAFKTHGYHSMALLGTLSYLKKRIIDFMESV